MLTGEVFDVATIESALPQLSQIVRLEDALESVSKDLGEVHDLDVSGVPFPVPVLSGHQERYISQRPKRGEGVDRSTWEYGISSAL